jgi:hypothetical protein
VSTQRKDLLGRPLGAEETALLDAYERCLALLDLDLPPTARAAAEEAAAALWQAVNNLALLDDRPEL